MKKRVLVVGILVVAALGAFAAAGSWRFARCEEKLPFAVDRTAFRNSADMLAVLGPPAEVVVTTAGDPEQRERIRASNGQAKIANTTPIVVLTWRPSCARSSHTVVGIVNRVTGETLRVHTEGVLR
jgi:hypothetical protein